VTLNGKVLVKTGALATTAVTVTSFNICNPTGIAEPATNVTTLDVYPNPNSGSFVVNLRSVKEEPATIVITNIVGGKVSELTTVTNKETAITTQLAPGIYFLSVSTANGRYTDKIVVNK